VGLKHHVLVVQIFECVVAENVYLYLQTIKSPGVELGSVGSSADVFGDPCWVGGRVQQAEQATIKSQGPVS